MVAASCAGRLHALRGKEKRGSKVERESVSRHREVEGDERTKAGCSLSDKDMISARKVESSPKSDSPAGLGALLTYNS